MQPSQAPHSARRPRGRPPAAPDAPRHRRQHERIETPDALEFSQALNFARSIGRDPNYFVTIQWHHAECSRPIPDRTRRILNLIGTWVRRRTGHSAVYAYVREGGVRKREHLHLVVHVPPALQTKFARSVRDWLTAEATGVVKPSAVRSSPIRDGELHGNLKSYLLKEGSEEVRNMFWVKAHHRKPIQPLLGKRTKVSHSIGARARREALQ